MPDIAEHVAFLSQQIGPRPAGTEEQQQAALYVTEHMQKEAGLSAVIEDFSSASGAEAPRAICCAITLVITIASLFLSVLAIPAIVLTIIAALLFAAEVFDRPIVSKLFARGVSQNVVAKYEPGYTPGSGSSRRRKIILVARYDSGKVRAELNGPVLGILPALQWANFGAMVFVPLLLIVRFVFFLHAEGIVAIVFNVLTVIALILVALPIIGALVHKLAAYNEAANCNASGVAVLMEVARRVGKGRVSEAELASRADGTTTIHGEEAARAAGLVPEGAQLAYEAANMVPPEPAPQSPEARLAAAKAAVAALSGKPVSSHVSTDIADNLVQVKEPPLPSPTEEDLRETRGETREALLTIPADTVREALGNAVDEGADSVSAVAAEAAVATAATSGAAASSFAPSMSAPAQQEDDGVPDWFKKAQEKAKKPKEDKGAVQRSRYADALDAALGESQGHFAQANEAVAASEMEVRLQQLRDGIMEVKAPQSQRPAATAASETEIVEPRADEGASVDLDAALTGALPDLPAVSAVPSADPSAGAMASDAGATCAMPPLDVSDLRASDVPAMPDVSLPSFLDPLKVRQEKLAEMAEQGEFDRTANRVDVTAAPIDGSGRIALAVSDEAAAAEASAGAAVPKAAPTRARRAIALPDIGVSAASPAPIAEMPKQRAPLADAESSGKSAAKSLLSMLPSINPAAEAAGGVDAGGGTSDSAPTKVPLRSQLPSLSGAISPRPAGPGDDAAAGNVSRTGSFAPIGATGTFAPVGDELLENVDPGDIYVEDADDSAYEENVTETGAFAGPGYVEMPKSRGLRLFDRFRRRKDKDEDLTPHEWLDVDESFDPRAAGAARGGWESFREEAEDGYAESDYSAGIADEQNPAEQPFAPATDDGFGFGEEDDSSAGPSEGRRRRSRWNGGGFSRRSMGRPEYEEVDEFDAEELGASGPLDAEPPELQQIYQFRHPDIDTEVWFVALGSELANHGGMKALLAEHAADLKGSIIIDLDALGAGELSVIEREGAYRKVKTSSRMKRYVKKASQATGIPVASASLLWRDSAASFAIKRGYQAMHLVGMDGAKPAFYAQGDDVLENVDEETLANNADFVMELLKNV